MNNRYLPFNNIKTEAVVQIDDDTCATKEDLEFGFRYADQFCCVLKLENISSCMWCMNSGAPEALKHWSREMYEC